MSAVIKGTTISLTRGDTLKLHVSIYRNNEEYEPSDEDVIRFALKKSVSDRKPLIVKFIPHDTMILTLDPEDTKGLSFGSYKYDFQLTNSIGEVDTFIGPAVFNITEEVD